MIFSSKRKSISSEDIHNAVSIVEKITLQLPKSINSNIFMTKMFKM